MLSLRTAPPQPSTDFALNGSNGDGLSDSSVPVDQLIQACSSVPSSVAGSSLGAQAASAAAAATAECNHEAFFSDAEKKLHAAPRTDPVRPLKGTEQTFNIMYVGESGLGKTTFKKSLISPLQARTKLYETQKSGAQSEKRQAIQATERDIHQAMGDQRRLAKEGHYADAKNAKAEHDRLKEQKLRQEAELKMLVAEDRRTSERLQEVKDKIQETRLKEKEHAEAQRFDEAEEKQQEVKVLEAEEAELQKMLSEPRDDPKDEQEAAGEGADEPALMQKTLDIECSKPLHIQVGCLGAIGYHHMCSGGWQY